MRGRAILRLLPVAATAGVLLFVAYERSDQLSAPPEAQAYMADCRDAAEAIPFSLDGGWIGQDAPVPTVATEILRPNLLVSRNFEPLVGGGRIGLLVVQTQDVQQLLGHYPPACYPGQGWTNLGGEPRDWSAGGFDLNGTEYRMVPPGGDEERPVHIYNFMLRPDGETGRDMDAVFAAGRTGQSRFFGAGQVQVLFFGDMDAERRDEVFATVVEAIRPTVEAILDGYDG